MAGCEPWFGPRPFKSASTNLVVLARTFSMTVERGFRNLKFVGVHVDLVWPKSTDRATSALLEQFRVGSADTNL